MPMVMRNYNQQLSELKMLLCRSALVKLKEREESPFLSKQNTQILSSESKSGNEHSLTFKSYLISQGQQAREDAVIAALQQIGEDILLAVVSGW